MAFLKKYQYSILLFLLSASIFCLGVLPNGAKLLHRHLLDPQAYVQTTAEVLAVTPYRTSLSREEYAITVQFFPGEERQEATIASTATPYEIGKEISVYYHVNSPHIVLESWYEWREFSIVLGFSALGFFTGMIMLTPPSPEYKPRKKRSLRERLKHY